MERKVGKFLEGHGHEVGGAPREGGDVPRYGEWFRERVLGLDTEAYRREFWREAWATGRSIGPEPRTLETLLRELSPYPGGRVGVLLELALLQGAVYPFWILARLLSRELGRLRRSTYYERERARRWRLADERVAIACAGPPTRVLGPKRSARPGGSSMRPGAVIMRSPSSAAGLCSRTSRATSTTMPM